MSAQYSVEHHSTRRQGHGEVTGQGWLTAYKDALLTPGALSFIFTVRWFNTVTITISAAWAWCSDTLISDAPTEEEYANLRH